MGRSIGVRSVKPRRQVPDVAVQGGSNFSGGDASEQDNVVQKVNVCGEFIKSQNRALFTTPAPRMSGKEAVGGETDSVVKEGTPKAAS